MTDNGVSPLHFIPIGRAIADPMELSTAVTMAIFGKKSADASIYENSDGEIVIGIHNPRTGGEDRLRPGDDHTAGQEFAIMLVHGGAVIRKAMREGDLDAFVISADGRYLRVPRLYWLKVSPTSSSVLEQTETGHVPAGLVGTPLLVDPADIEKWTAAVRPAVQAMVNKTREARGENVVELKPGATTRGAEPMQIVGMGVERGVLPSFAKPADRRDEEFAHQAAELVRSGVKLADALRQVAPEDRSRSEESVQQGVRRTFGLMYDRDGRPIQP